MSPVFTIIPKRAFLTVAIFSWCCASFISALGVVQQQLDCDRAAVSRKDILGCSWMMAYNGYSITGYDTQAGLLTAESPTVKTEVDSLNRDPKALKDIWVEVQDAIDFLSQLLEAGAGTLDREVPPSVTVSFKDLETFGRSSQLQCIVAGFYPRALNVSWLRNGGSVNQQLAQTPILSNGERTFQTAAFIDIDPKTEDTYTCFVEHITYPEGHRTDWVRQRKGPLSTAAVIGIVFGIVGILTAVGGGLVRMERQGHQPQIVEPKVLFQKCQRGPMSNRTQTSMRPNASASSATSGDGLTKHTV
ncbi:SLA class II histocompatibility antigen, DQ haplotype C beta chain-like [Scyliorhinus canicula]|uniref:SLA class II histocompatibility antigen, DQ haplotype C beta chain-like n=1 Tax=Scyliorhinus canicula TaxID=7830 RepID=UPI0018F6ACE5|nr:SLA class II histocompatibility antigen, DQ haplotype C beta chain-like [Scyliorhinus canicula]